MITKEEAIRIAEEYLKNSTRKPRTGGAVRVVDDEATLERKYGWLFIYNTLDFVRTRERRYRLVGNGPLLVLREDGSLIQFSSAYDREGALAAYEADAEKHMAKAIHPE